MNINTKQMPSGLWSCFATIKGYDYAFTAKFMVTAQIDMMGLLKKIGVKDATWLDAVIFTKMPTGNPMNFRPMKIDNL